MLRSIDMSMHFRNFILDKSVDELFESFLPISYHLIALDIN